MFTSYDKAIAALIAPVLSILVLSGVLPESFNGEEFLAGLTAIVTAIAVYVIPNKE